MRTTEEYVKAVESGLEGVDTPSFGACPGCKECADDHGMDLEEFNEAYEKCEISNEGHFSWGVCGICHSDLGGDRYTWHWWDKQSDEIIHESDGCANCLFFLCNGDLPEFPE